MPSTSERRSSGSDKLFVIMRGLAVGSVDRSHTENVLGGLEDILFFNDAREALLKAIAD